MTEYTKEMVSRILGDGENLAASDPRFKKYIHRVNADHQGRFVFNQLPAGADGVQYYLEGFGGDTSNAAIAAELHLSVATVKSHVSAVLSKLGLDNRVQIALLVQDAQRS